MTQQKIHVHKFGGSSVATAQRFRAVKPLLSGKNEIIVVSAMQGVTNTLQHALDAARSNSAYLELLNDLEIMHLDAINQLPIHQNSPLTTAIATDFSEIKKILYAVHLTSSYSKEIQNIILGYGEIWSTQILATYLSEYNRVLYLNAANVLFMFEKNDLIYIDWQKSQVALDDFLKDKVYDQLIITGFIARTLDGKRSTLGRNGSDFSAAIFAKLLRADSLTIWTDVDGIFTADPNKVRSAFAIESLSYQEALELAYFGAKVLHPMTIAPVLEFNIPVLIKNSFNPNAAGTCISASSKKSDYSIKGLTSIDHVALINIEGAGMIGVSGMVARVFQILQQHHISVILIAQASSEHSICFAVASADSDRATETLTDQLKFEMEYQHIQRISVNQSCGILSIVGDAMIGSVGSSAKLCNSLAKANVNIYAISQGSSERNISVVIHNKDLNKALQAVHAGFYLSRKTISIGIIGPGQVGTSLLAQINATIQQLKSTSQANILIRGIMNSKTMLLSHESINLSNWREQFDSSQHIANLDDFVNHIIADDIPHAAIIDCTANQDIAKEYLRFIEKGIHVVTPNKHANAGDLEYYKKLKSFARKKNNHYLYEATVCAGLPVINTLQDLIKTGDQVNRIEGVLSGTLSYIFSELVKGRVFSEIVLEAKARGYTEPDPREDLSGMDVARKLVCLAREMGFDVHLSDIHIYNLVPEELKSCSIAEFFEKLPLYDDQMKQRTDDANHRKEKLRYVGSIDLDGNMQVDIKSFPQHHPFSGLNGSDNMLIFHTKRYHEQPLVIQGPGAGAEVTAAGIFADVLRLISFLS